VEKQVAIGGPSSNLPALMLEVEKSGVLHLTRKGEPVAVLLSSKKYDCLRQRSQLDLWDAREHFRETEAASPVPFSDQELEGLRDSIAPRDFHWPE
jgi:prevent-host-death family protein